MKTLYKGIASLPLKEMDGSLLAVAIMQEATEAGVSCLEELDEAISVASYLHRDDTRANRGGLPRDTYITHPLRNTLRLLRYYGVTDSDVLIASVLHDTVEDHPIQISEQLAGIPTEGLTASEIRNIALSFLSGRYGAEVARIVSAVSNPILTESYSKEEKRVMYAEHINSAIANDLSVFLVKFADFYDNAGSLHHTKSNKGMTQHLVLKYTPVIDIFKRHGAVLMEPLNEERGLKFARHLGAVERRLEVLAAEV